MEDWIETFERLRRKRGVNDFSLTLVLFAYQRVVIRALLRLRFLDLIDTFHDSDTVTK